MSVVIDPRSPAAIARRAPALLTPGRMPSGALRAARGRVPLALYLLGGRYQLADISGRTTASIVGSPVLRATDVYFDQTSAAQYLELSADVAAGAAATLLLYCRKDILAQTSGRHRVLAAMGNRSAANEATRYTMTLGNDFGGAGTKDCVRAELSASTGLWINGVRQASNNISDVEYGVGSLLCIVVRVSALDDGLANTCIGGGAGSAQSGMKGPIMVAGLLPGELSDGQCAALSASIYSAVEHVNDAPFVVPSAAAATQYLGPAGIPSGEAFGAPAIAPGPVSVQPSGIPGGESFGVAALVRGAVTIAPTGVASGEAFGELVMQAGAVTVQPVGIDTGEAFGGVAVQPGSVIVLPDGIPSAEVFGNQLVIPGATVLQPVGVASAEAFGTLRVVGGDNAVGWLVAQIKTMAALQADTDARPALTGRPGVRGGAA